MKTNWQTKKLDEVCDISIGKTPSRGNKKFWDEEKETNNIWLSIRDLKNTNKKGVFDSREYISDSGAKLCKKIKQGTLLASFKLTLGRLAFAGVGLYTNEAIAALKIKNSKELKKEYLYYYLTFFDWHAETKGDVKVKGKTLNKAKLKKIKVFLPSLPEQIHIVKILDEVFAKIETAKNNAEKNLANSKELFESYLQNVFENHGEDWEDKELGEICEIKSKLIDPRKDKFIDLIHIGAGNIKSKTGELKDLKTSREEKLISGKFVFDDSMILYSKIRPYLMKIVKPTFKGLCSADIYPLVPSKGKLTRSYLYYLFLSRQFTNYAIKGSSRAGMPKVNRRHLFAFKTNLPLVSKQKQITTKLDTLSAQTKKLEKIYQQKIDDLEELKKSVLQSAFAGKL